MREVYPSSKRTRPCLEEAVIRQMGRAIHHYRQIEGGDHIGVAVSGGVDSLILLHLLTERKKRVPIMYELVVLHVYWGFDGEDYLPLFGGVLTIIRPFAFLPKEKILQLATKMGLPAWENKCPSITRSKRGRSGRY
jgi:tRNA(Ile)-lysidine synthase TilS/MesJ